MTAAYVLSLAAEADLRAIIRYTQQQWGGAQTRSYLAKLKRGINGIAAGQGFKDMASLHPNLRMAHCEHHYVFVCIAMKRPPSWWRFFTSAWI